MDCSTNIVTANFSGGKREATTAPLYQWDYGQVLCITGLDALPQTFEVHFATQKNGGVSTTVVGIDGRVDIPNVLLTIGKDIHAWIYLSDSTGDGETEYAITTPVKARPMPEYYDAEATGVFDGVVRQVGEYAEEATAAAERAATSATAAATSEDNAAASASAAAQSAASAATSASQAYLSLRETESARDDASAKASEASAKASEAAQSAYYSRVYKEDAEAAKVAAGNYKADAAESAAAAANAATSAGNAAQGAGQAAAAAGQSAGQAVQSATEAAQSATTASTAAQTATEKAAEASASATAAEAAKTAAQTAQAAAETAKDTAVESATTASAKAAEAAQSASDADADADRAEDAAELAQTTVNALALTKTVSGNMVTITDGADGMPLRKLSVDITAVQSGSGDPSPENIRPITGFDAVTVTRSGINLIDQSHITEASGWTLSTVDGYTELDGVPVYTGTTRNLYTAFGSDGYPMTANAFEENTQYTATLRWRSDESTLNGVKVGFLYTDGTKESYGTSAGSPTWKRQTLTSAEGKTVEGLYFTYNSNYTIMMAGLAVVKASEYDEDVVYPSTVQSVTIPLGDTVYGGTLDVTTGKLTVDMGRMLIKDISWAYQENYTRFFSSGLQNQILAPTAQTVQGEIISEVYKTSAYNVYTDMQIAVGTTGAVFIKDSRFTDKDNFLASVGDYALVYKLATPIEIDLTPDTLTTLKGLNKIWANSGAISIEYHVDMEIGIAEIARETVRIDDTLTNAGEAADAKVTGDAIASVKATQIVASESGAVASFTDGADGVPVRSLVVAFEPIQNLNGQSNPYPAGGGVNLFDESTVTIGNWYSNSGTLSTNAPYGCVSADIPATGGETYAIKCYGEIPYSMSVVEFDDNGFLTRNHVANSQTKTVTTTAGTTKIAIQFAASGASDITPMTADILASYQAVFYKGETAPDVYAPYSNICPINGRDAVTVMRSGINLISKDMVRGYPDNTVSSATAKRKFTPNTFVVGVAYNNYYNASAITDFSYENGVLTFTSRSSGYGVGIPIIVKGGYQYTFSATLTDLSCRAMFYDADGNYIGFKALTNATVTAPDDAVCAVFCLFKTTSGTFTASDIMVTYGSTAQSYVDGNAEYVTFPLGDTVYGGTVDVATGVMMVDYVADDMGDLDWTYTATGTYPYFTTSLPAPARNRNIGEHGVICCERYEAIANLQAATFREADYSYKISINSGISSSYRLIVQDPTITDAETFKTAVTGVKVVTALATPFTIQLTPEQISTLKGQNNIWSDAGDVSVDYVADTKLYIEALTEPDADMVADANITSGHYFMVGNSLYLATANIESGGAIVPGTNCTKTNLADALNAINA